MLNVVNRNLFRKNSLADLNKSLESLRAIQQIEKKQKVQSARSI